MRWLIFVVLACSCGLFGQITVTSDPGAGWGCSSLTCSTSEIQHASQTYPIHYAIAGTGTISVGTITGTGSSGFTFRVLSVGCDPCESPISSVTAASPPTYTYTDSNINSHIANGQAVTIENVATCTGANGQGVVANLNTGAKTFQITGFSVSGACSGGNVWVTTNTAPADGFGYYNGYADYDYSFGAHSADIPITGGSGGSFHAIVNLTILALAAPTITTPSGSTAGCSSSDAVFFIDLDACAPSNMRPSGTYSFAAVGSAALPDSNFGGVVYTVAQNVPPNVIAVSPSDTVVTNVNSDGSLMVVGTNTGNLDYTSTTPPFTVGWHNPTGIVSGSSQKWSGLNPKVVFYYSGVTLHRATFGTAPAITSDVIIWTDGDAGAVLGDGGDSEATKDDWFAQVDGVNKKLWFINGNCNTTNCATVASISFAGLSPFIFRTVITTPGVDVVSGLRYITLYNNSGAHELYTFNGTTLTDVGPYPTLPGLGSLFGYLTGKGSCTAVQNAAGLCIGAATDHTAGGEIAGQQAWCGATLGRYQPGRSWFTCSLFNKGLNQMFIDQANGGGMIQVFPVNTETSDTHTGAARQGQVFSLSSDGAPLTTSWAVTNAVTNGSNIDLTVRTTDHGHTGGDLSVTLSGTITNVATTFTLSATCDVDGHCFSAPASLQLDAEILTCTTLVSTVYSGCTRAQQGTSAAAHTTGAVVYQQNNPLTLVSTNSVTISNVGGCTNANGNRTVTVVGVTVTLPGVTCNAGYTANTGVAYLNLAPTTVQHESELDVIYMPSTVTSAAIVKRFAMSRSFAFQDTYLQNAPNPYYDQPHAAISQDGSKLMWEGNNGLADTVSVYYANTGFGTPTFSISKTHAGNFTQGQQNAPYTITITNSGGVATNGSLVTATDTVPAGESLVSMSGAGWTCVSNSCTRSDVLNPASAYPAITVLVNVASNASSPQLELASVSGGGSASANASDSTTIIPTSGPILGIAKSHLGNFAQGQQNAVSSIVVSNTGGSATDGTVVTVTETIPTGETLASLSGTGWTCASNSCTRSDALVASASYPVITVRVNVAINATSPQTNQCSVSGGGSASANASDSQIIIPLLTYPSSILRVSREILR